MARHSNDVKGFVNFPIAQPGWRNTKEGGMFVRLVVVDPNREWMQCCGGNNYTIMDESYQGDDNREEPTFPEKFAPGAIKKFYKAQNEYVAYHFPHWDSDEPNYLSTGYLAVLTLGSTGWSGYHDDYGYFRCTYGDLTDEGKKLYDTVGRLYPDCHIHIQTWLDT